MSKKKKNKPLSRLETEFWALRQLYINLWFDIMRYVYGVKPRRCDNSVFLEKL